MMTTAPFVARCRVRHPSFGLGIVESVELRRIHIRFDDSTIRIFNPHGGALERVRWQPGQPVMVRNSNLLGIVKGSKLENGLYHYLVQTQDAGPRYLVAESGLSDAPGLQDPVDLLKQQRFEDPKLFYFRTMGHYLACTRQGLGISHISARILPKAHQIFVAHRVLEAPRVRFLLADEVGLGKTIEAGLIVQELRARGSLERVLIVVPPNLALQWLYELKQKFNESFKFYDADRVRDEHQMHPEENVWARGRNILCSQHYITSHEEEWADILATPWDMVIFDEAHHVRRQMAGGHRRSATTLYRFASQISERTRDLLLLTATPMQLHPFELFSLIELLDPALFYSYEYFEEQREQTKALNIAIKRLAESKSLAPNELASLRTDLVNLVPDSADLPNVLTSQLARDRVVEHLSARHLLSEVMIRNRKRLVGGFTRRIPRIITVDLSPDERDLYQALFTYVRTVYRSLDAHKKGFIGFMLVNYQKRLTSSRHAFTISLEHRLQKLAAKEVVSTDPGGAAWADADTDEVIQSFADQLTFSSDDSAVEIEVGGLRIMLEQARRITSDTKYNTLVTCLEEIFRGNPSEQVLIFTQFYDTLHFLEAELGARWPVAAFHGTLASKAKDLAVARFRQGDVQILLTTEAGGEGRNLQFCAVLINYDLPWNPMKVEQRIGRVDRIGQTRDVQIYNFSLSGTVEERVLEVLNQRIHAFEETIGGLDPILGQMEIDVQNIVLESNPTDLAGALTEYADRVEAEVAQAKKAEDVLRDFVMDWRSYDSRVQGLLDTAEQDRLVRHMNKWSKAILKHLNASIRPLGKDSFSIHLGKTMQAELPKARRDTYQITFNHHEALEDEQVEYGSFGHPLFDALLDYATGDVFDKGLVARRTLVDVEQAGFQGFQFNFLVRLRSVREFRRVVPVIVSIDGSARSDLRDLALDSFDWQNPAAPFDPTTYPDWADRVAHAWDAAEEAMIGELNEEVTTLKTRSQEAYTAEKRKINQYCTYREREAERKLTHDSTILTRLQTAGSEGERRIIPVWERNVENDRAYLATLGPERTRLERELEQRQQVSYSYELLNVAWIVVTSP